MSFKWCEWAVGSHLQAKSFHMQNESYMCIRNSAKIQRSYQQKFLNDPDGTGIKTKNCDKVHFLKVYLKVCTKRPLVTIS